MTEGPVELPDSYRPQASGARRIGDPSPDEEVEVTITLRGPQLPAAGAVTGPPVDAGAFAATYGADADDAAKVQEELEKLGLQVYDVSLAGRSLHARGTVQQLRSAFGVSFGLYESDDQGQFRGREGSISVPAPLAGIITGVFGLDERRMARRKNAPAQAAQAGPPLAPADLESRYQFPEGDGAGQTVAIAEFGGAYFASDVQAFCEKYGRPVPAVTPVSAGFPLMTAGQVAKLPKALRLRVLDDSVEVMMDVEIVAALCPAASISVYFAPFSEKGWIDLINAVTAARPVPVALSVSWGKAEDSADWSGSAVREINQRLQAAAMLGVTVCAASGDDGAGDRVDDGRAHVHFPAASPFVLSVGGTMVDGTPPAEVVWWVSPGERASDGSTDAGATGGGVSTVFRRPAWQTVTVASLNAGSIDGRVVPDVSALAGSPYYDLIFQGKDSPNGGTSAATPLWAALLARIAAGLPAGKHLRFITPLLYGATPGGEPAGQAGCADITSGDNRSPGIPQGYTATAGYDAVSGWGTPIGTRLQQLLS
jgi:kumamolisin